MVIRHGDVNLVEISPAQWEQIVKQGKRVVHDGTYVLARGEATGSVHQLSVENPADLELIEQDGTLYLRLMTPGTLTHTSDHELLTVMPRIYRQVTEREVDWFSNTVRKVVD